MCQIGAIYGASAFGRYAAHTRKHARARAHVRSCLSQHKHQWHLLWDDAPPTSVAGKSLGNASCIVK